MYYVHISNSNEWLLQRTPLVHDAMIVATFYGCSSLQGYKSANVCMYIVHVRVLACACEIHLHFIEPCNTSHADTVCILFNSKGIRLL